MNDGLGKDITNERVAQAFAAWALAGRAVIADLHRVRRQVLSLAESPDGCLINAQRINVEFRNIVAELRFAQPYTTCPLGTNCDRGCRYCKGTHWVTRKVYERIPEELKL